MKKYPKIVAIVALLLAWQSPASAQDDGMEFDSVEIYACSYNDRQGPEDLDRAVVRWNRWMDQSGAEPYMAWTFTKHYVTAEQEFDFLWIGAAPDAATMGAGADHYRANGGEMAEMFAEIANCPTIVNAVSLQVKEPAEERPASDTPVLTIATCTVAEGRRTEDAIAAISRWGEHRNEGGSAANTYIWFPAWGAGAVEADFQLVNSYPNHAAMGQEMQWYLDNEEWNNARQALAGLVSCDVPRVYDGTTRRMPPE